MKIRIDLKIFLFVLLFLFLNKIETYIFLMLFALIHELGHLFCGIALGLEPREISIMPFGFSLNFKPVENKGKGIYVKRIFIELSGPIVSMILAMIFWKTDKNLAYCNLLLAVFNMLPIYPLDGGRVVRNIAQIFKEKTEYIKKISNAISVIIITLLFILTLYYKNAILLIMDIYLIGIIFKSKKEIELKEKIYKKIREKNLQN